MKEAGSFCRPLDELEACCTRYSEWASVAEISETRLYRILGSYTDFRCTKAMLADQIQETHDPMTVCRI